MSKKSRAEWSILINSTNAKTMNLAGMCVFALNAFLYTFLAVRNSFRANKLDYYIVFAFMWLIMTFVYFFRIFYNSESNCLAKILPNAKRIYTKKLPFIFCLLNSFVGIVILVVYFANYSKGKATPIIYLIFLLFCLFSLILTFCIKPLVLALKQEKAMTWTMSFSKSAWLLLGIVFLDALVLSLITILIGHFKEELISFIEGNLIFYICFCEALIIISWITTFRAFNKLYKQR